MRGRTSLGQAPFIGWRGSQGIPISALAAQLLPKPGDLIAGRYRVDCILGKGGMGAVYRATHEASRRPVAVKWMLPSAAADESAIERFLIEARTMALIDHPNVVGILDMGEDGGAPFLVMELLRGESLRERLDKRKRLGIAETVDLLLPAMRGVAEAHREGVVHRDLKPGNILLCQSKDGRPREAKVIDFGISKLAEHAEGSGPITKTGIAIGTPGYMSPEQLNAPKVVDPRFDVYAMGVVLYECLTGRMPYHAEGLMELILQIAGGQAVPPSRLAPEIPPELDRIVLGAMCARVEQRIASMEHLVQALEHVRPALPAGDGTALSGLGAEPAVTPQTPWPAGSGPVLRGPHGTMSMPDRSTPQRGVTDRPATPHLAVLQVQPPASGLRWVLVAGAALLVAIGGALALAILVWTLAGDEPDAPVARGASEPASAVTAPPTPAPVEPTADEADPHAAPNGTPLGSEASATAAEPGPPTYVEVTADLAAHAGAQLSLSGSVVHVEGREGAFLVFVAEPGCGGTQACALRVTGAPLAPPAGQAVRVHGRLAGSHRYRTRSGAEREVPELAVERIELLATLEAPAVDDAERPAERTPAAVLPRAVLPRAERPRIQTPRPLAPAPITPAPLSAPASSPPRPRTFRPVISSDEI